MDLAADDRLDAAPCGFVSFGDDGTVSYINATLCDRLGYTREELTGARFETLLTVAGRIFYQTHLFPLLRMQGRAQEVFLLLRTRGGDEMGALCNALHHPLADGGRTDCVVMEVHERRKYEDALLQAKREAEYAKERLEQQACELELQHQQLQEQATELEVQAEALQKLNSDLLSRSAAADAANRAKSEFLTVMSHELRTPLNAIGGYTELLETGVYGPVNPAQLPALKRITRSQRHLLGLINDVLNLARIETGRVDFDISDVGLREVLGEVSEMISPQVTTKQITYHVEKPDAGLHLRADREKLVQVVLNLLSNAVKFTPPGGSISVRASDVAPGAKTVVLYIEDTGRGIPADRLDAIFEPFVQVRADLGDLTEGTGLGLAISRNLARGMGGELSATSTLGSGSCFSLTLPLSAD